jgi:hypothetical protein
MALDQFEFGDLAFGLTIGPRFAMGALTAALSFIIPVAKEPIWLVCA